jgi:hypothetical protein
MTRIIAILLLSPCLAFTKPPPESVIHSCLAARPLGHGTTVKQIPMTYISKEENYISGFDASLLLHAAGLSFGYLTGQSGDALTINHNLFPLKNATIAYGPLPAQTFEPYTAEWLFITKAKIQYLCASFNFEGLGRSGSFQNIRGGYLIKTMNNRRTLYYATGDIRNLQ